MTQVSLRALTLSDNYRWGDILSLPSDQLIY